MSFTGPPIEAGTHGVAESRGALTEDRLRAKFVDSEMVRPGRHRSPETHFGAARCADKSSRIDAALYLNGICKLYRIAHPDCAVLDCAIEDNGAGLLTEAICRILGLVLCELMSGAQACVPSKETPPRIRIALRRNESIVLCAISSRWFTDSGCWVPAALHCTEQMVKALGSSCALRLVPEFDLIAIMLDPENAERRIPAAMSAYRAARPVAGHASW